jgi:hypothetical protein
MIEIADGFLICASRLREKPLPLNATNSRWREAG